MRLFAFILSVLLCSCTAQTDRYIIEGTTSQTGHYYLFKGYELVDSAEVIMPSDMWPMPSYGALTYWY